MEQIALVTGSSRGIGRAVAVELARKGWAVCVNYRVRQDCAEELVRQLESEGCRAMAVQADVSDRAQVNAMVGERIAHAAAVGVGVGHEGALAALAHHQPLLLQLADGLTDGIAADVQRAAELRLGGEQVADVQRAGGDAAFDNADQLRIQRNVAVERELVGQDRILFHMLGVPFP